MVIRKIHRTMTPKLCGMLNWRVKWWLQWEETSFRAVYWLICKGCKSTSKRSLCSRLLMMLDPKYYRGWGRGRGRHLGRGRQYASKEHIENVINVINWGIFDWNVLNWRTNDMKVMKRWKAAHIQEWDLLGERPVDILGLKFKHEVTGTTLKLWLKEREGCKSSDGRFIWGNFYLGLSCSTFDK